MSEAFPVTGLNELYAYLQAFPRRLQTGALRAGAVAAAAVVRDEARLRARRKSGKMAKAIKSGSARMRSDGSVAIRVRLSGKHSYLGWFWEYGVAPHFLQAGDSGLSPRKLTQKAGREGMTKHSEHVLKIGDQFVSGAVHHPGLVAEPFLRPALDAKAREAVIAFRGRIKAFIESKTGFVAPIAEDE